MTASTSPSVGSWVIGEQRPELGLDGAYGLIDHDQFGLETVDNQRLAGPEGGPNDDVRELQGVAQQVCEFIKLSWFSGSKTAPSS